VSCITQGFNYVYFSFFSVLLFGFAAIYSYVNYRSNEAIRVASVAIVLIIGATVINLSPAFYSWYKHGKPPEMNYKYPAEAEIFGAKIRRMIVPHKDNPVPIIGHWGKADALAGYPNENENMTARLGLVGAAGFVLLLLISLQLVRVDTAGAEAGILHSLAALTLFALVMITVGGFGALFNLAVAPDIRAYNRFSVFISFFSLAGLGLFLERYRCTSSGRANWKLLLPMSLVACFSLYDQLLDRSGLLLSRDEDIARYRDEKALLDQFNGLYPNGVSTLQLPMTGFPPLSIHENMESYDHLRPFLWSNSRARWSWPSFSQRHRAWQEGISGLDGDALVKAAIYSGFLAIWIDRFGYKDRGTKLIAGLLAAGGRIVLTNSRHVIVDLHEAMENVKTNESPEDFRAHVDYWLKRSLR
jgi:phosphoglycerol transferase